MGRAAIRHGRGGGQRLRVGVVLAVLLAGSAPTASALPGPPSLDEIVTKVQATCARTRDLSAHFEQIATIKSLDQVQKASGILLLKRPEKMRWEYRTPEPRLFVTDGKTLWAYSPAEKQVVVQQIDQAFASRLPLAILAGDCALRKDFQVSQVVNAATRGSTTSAILDLTPRHPEAGIARMLLEVSLKDYTVTRTTIFDSQGNTTVITLSEVKLDPGIPEQEFTFTPPAGVRVVKPPSQ
jgi:outer membrane lipoprotein carrier protein